MPGPGYSFFGAEERANVEKVLEHWTLTRYSYGIGPETNSFVHEFELAAQQLFGMPHAVGVNSGTSALLASLAALGVGPGDEVIVPGYTFIASIASIVYSGATPVLAEVDESLTLDPVDVEAKVTSRTRAIMPVHMLGAPCDLTALSELAGRHDLLMIEDVAQACGASFAGKRLGAFGDAAAFSLNHFKVITSGEGGFALFADERAYKRAYAFQDHGWLPLRDEEAKGDVLFGLNLRMPELTGAIACAQLQKLDRVLDSTRRVKGELSRRIPEFEGLSRRVLHDAEGECGTLLVYIFDDVTDAEAVASALGTRTLVNSGRHFYGNMPQLPGLMEPGAPTVAFTRSASSLDYRPGSLPNTDSVLSRALGVSVGVSDDYLGSGFGVTVHSSAAEIDAAANKFSSALDKVLG